MSLGQPPDNTPEKAFLWKEVRRYCYLQTESKKKIKTLQQAQRHLKKKIAKMQDIIDNLPKNSILIDENLLVLQSLAEVNKDLLMRQVVQKRGVPQPVQ